MERGQVNCVCVHVCMLGHSVCPTLCDQSTIVDQTPLSVIGFPRQEHCSGLPFPFLGNLPDPVIEPTSAALVGGFFIAESPGKPYVA